MPFDKKFVAIALAFALLVAVVALLARPDAFLVLFQSAPPSWYDITVEYLEGNPKYVTQDFFRFDFDVGLPQYTPMQIPEKVEIIIMPSTEFYENFYEFTVQPCDAPGKGDSKIVIWLGDKKGKVISGLKSECKIIPNLLEQQFGVTFLGSNNLAARQQNPADGLKETWPVRIEVYYRDGDDAGGDIEFTLFFHPPVVQIQQPSENPIVSPTITLAALDDAGSEPELVTFYYYPPGGLDWVEIGDGQDDGFGNYEISWDLAGSGITNGSYEIMAKACDSLEIFCDEAPSTLTVSVQHDNVDPEISNESPVGIINDTTPLISAIVYDADSGIDPSSLEMEINKIDDSYNRVVNYLELSYEPSTGLVEYVSEELADGEYAITLIVSDNYYHYTTSNWQFTVSSGGSPDIETVEATIVAVPTSGETPLTVSFDFKCTSSTGEEISKCFVDYGDDGTDNKDFGPGTGEITVTEEHTFLYTETQNEYNVTLTARGTTPDVENSASVMITVLPEGSVEAMVQAIIEADPVYGTTPLSVSFNLTCSSTTSPINFCEIDYGDGLTDALGAGANTVTAYTEHIFEHSLEKDRFTVKLTAMDESGLSNYSTVQILVYPEEKISPLELNLYSLDENVGEAPYTRTFIVGVSGGIPPYIYKWDFEADGELDVEGNESTVKYIFGEPGTYTTSVKVFDSEGRMAFETIGTEVTEKTVLPGEKEYDLEISLLSPDLEKTYGYGQLVYFKVEVLLDGEPIPPEYVDQLSIAGKGDTVENYFVYNPDRKAYEISNFEMPSEKTEENFKEYSLLVGATVDGQQLSDYKKIKLKLSKEINIEFLYPLDFNLLGRETVLDPKNPNKIAVRLTYPDGSPYYREEPIQAVFADVGNNAETGILLQKKEDHYEATLDYELREGENTFEIRLEDVDIESEPRRIVAILVKPINWFSLVLVIIAVAALLLAIYFTSSLLRERARIRRHLELERKNLKGLAKKLKFEYYKRHISEKEYKERLLKTQQQLATVDELLGIKEDVSKRPAKEKENEKKKVMKEIEARAKEEKGKSLFEKFEWRIGNLLREKEQAVEKDLKGKFSESEREEIKRLVFVLRKSVSNYSREEMTKAILAQGYSPQVAEKVVEMLYK